MEVFKFQILVAVTVGVFLLSGFGIWRAPDKDQAAPYLNLLTLVVVAWLKPPDGNS